VQRGGRLWAAAAVTQAPATAQQATAGSSQTSEANQQSAAPASGVAPAAAIGAASAISSSASISSGNAQKKTGLLEALGLAFVGGLLLNLMPCVFPVLFLKGLALVRSGNEERRTLAAAWAGVYGWNCRVVLGVGGDAACAQSCGKHDRVGIPVSVACGALAYGGATVFLGLFAGGAV